MKSIRFLPLLALAAGLASQVSAQGTLVTLVVPKATTAEGAQAFIDFKTNQIVTVVGIHGQDPKRPGEVQLHFADGTVVSGGNPPLEGMTTPETPLAVGHKLTGLTKIVAKNRNSASGVAYTFAIAKPGSEPTTLPNSTVVIPTDATGPVRIILESSTDLVNWVEANPGTYSKDQPNRFFRLRAVSE